MKYQIKSDGDEADRDFEIVQVKILKEKTRARIVSSTVVVWLTILLVSAALAAINGRPGDLQMILGFLTPLVTMAFGWYLGREHRE